MTKIFSDLPNWNFYLDEIAANVFEAIAVDKEGRVFRMSERIWMQPLVNARMRQRKWMIC